MEVSNLIIEIKWRNARFIVSKVLINRKISLNIWFVSFNALEICERIIKGKRQIWQLKSKKKTTKNTFVNQFGENENPH